jgi:hypothetical protein
MSTSFRQIRKWLAPRWLLDGEGGLVGYSLDVVKDAFIQRLEQGLLARLPQNDPTGQTTAPADALSAMGRDRRVVRGINESDVSYAARLVAWLDDRRTAGNPYTLMQKLSEYTGAGCAFRTYDARGNCYSRAVDGTRTFVQGTGWDWDAEPASHWSRFWVVIYPPSTLWTRTKKWGGPAGAWGETGATWGSTATSEQVQTIRALVSDWKPAGTRCVNIVVAFDPASFDPAAPEPDGLWGSWSKVVAGVRVPARLASAIYWDGV